MASGSSPKVLLAIVGEAFVTTIAVRVLVKVLSVMSAVPRASIATAK